MTTIINTKIGESRNVARLWLEGQKLLRAGVVTGKRYTLVRNDKVAERVELKEVDETFQGKAWSVSKRERRGIRVPLLEVRSDELREIFSCERVRVAIRQGRIIITANHQDLKLKARLQKLTDKLKGKKPLAICSLFHGGGVIDKAMHSGLLRAGVNSFVQVGVEIEPAYLDASLRNNLEIWNEESIAICGDIRDVDWSDAPECEILVGSTPCTGASRAGRSKNNLSCAEEHDAAGAMFVNYLDAVKATNPAIAILENVPDYQATASMMVIRSVLHSLGYQISECIMDGNAFGALERRKRLVMVAVSNGMPAFDFSEVQPVRVKEGALAEVMENVPLDSDRWKSFDYLAAKEIRDKKAGKGFMRQLLDGSEEFCGTIGRLYAKCRSTEPFIVHPEDSSLSRLFTPVEHARVKAIPESIIAGESDTTSHEILGQSVIYPVFVAVAQAIGWSVAKALGMSAPAVNLNQTATITRVAIAEQPAVSKAQHTQMALAI